MTERQYLPTIAELLDRLSICLLKSVFIRPELYEEEIKQIEHDVDMIIAESDYRFRAIDLRAVLVIMLANHFIWTNESDIRNGAYLNDQALRRLIGTHSINGVRNVAKNKIMQRFGGRMDYKIDCLAADLPQEFGNWRGVLD